MLGLDVGGANLKVADGGESMSIPTPLWTEEGRRRLREEVEGLGDVAATLTGELADVFPSRREGVLNLLDFLEGAGGEVLVYGYDGFATPGGVREDPLAFAGANWAASAELVAEEVGPCVLVDVGSTTSDVIPVGSCTSRSDLERLSKGELVYSGALRTDVSAVAREVEVRGDCVPLARERFAITADVYRSLGFIDDERYVPVTPDGRSTSTGDCLRRLARTVCSDLEELRRSEVLAVADQVFEEQVHELRDAVELQAGEAGSDTAAICGSGDFVAREAVEETSLDALHLEQVFGEVAETLPAYAVSVLAGVER